MIRMSQFVQLAGAVFCGTVFNMHCSCVCLTCLFHASFCDDISVKCIGVRTVSCWHGMPIAVMSVVDLWCY